MRIIALYAVLAAIILLQIFLFSRENKWFGLIMPVISFLFALVVVLLNTIVPATGVGVDYILNLVVAFAVYNIPTVVFMVIYIVCRKRKCKKVV